MAQDYYKTLGIEKTATEQDIKSAFKKLAKQYHPDKAKGEAQKKEFEDKFKEINEAYQILSDAQKRKQYDTFGSAGFNGTGGAGFDPFGGAGGFNWQGAQGNFDFNDLNDIFGDIFGFGSRHRKGRDLRYSMTIDFIESIKGIKKTININGFDINVNVPSGIRSGTMIKYAGKGENPGNNIPPGDLIIEINIKPSSEFKRNGYDLYTTKEVELKKALLGGEVDVKVIDEKSETGFKNVKMKIPEGTSSYTDFRLKSKGMPYPNSNGRGDLYVQVIVKFPKKLTQQQRDTLEKIL